MEATKIILIIIILLFAWIQVTAIIKHIFESKLGTMVFEFIKPQFQFIVHSAMVQMALAFILNYERGFFISIHILNLHFCFIYIPKKYRVAPGLTASPMDFVAEKPTISITEWMRNGIENMEKNFPDAMGDTFYFRALEQGYTLQDIDHALEHWRAIGAKAYWDMHKQEIILTIPQNENNN